MHALKTSRSFRYNVLKIRNGGSYLLKLQKIKQRNILRQGSFYIL